MHIRIRRLLSLAKYLNRVNLSRVEFVDIQGNSFVRKQPLGHSPFFRVLANELLRYRSAPVIVLKREEWHRRELYIYNQLYRKEAYVDEEKRLLMEKLDGKTLRAVLTGGSRTDEERHLALRLAARALRSFHQYSSNEPSAEPLSHSDATANNVLVELAAQQAWWIDFDLVHRVEAPTSLRQADDLRSLIFSAVPLFPQAQIYTALQETLQAYSDPIVLRTLRDKILPTGLDWDLYHWAQARITAEVHEFCRNSLLHLLRSYG